MIEFRVSPHLVRTGCPVIEVWHHGAFIASIYGDEDCMGRARITVISKHRIAVSEERDLRIASSVTTIEERSA